MSTVKTQNHCNARQYNDQMMCSHCGLAWDVNDLDPPACKPMSNRSRRRERGLRQIQKLRQRYFKK